MHLLSLPQRCSPKWLDNTRLASGPASWKKAPASTVNALTVRSKPSIHLWIPSTNHTKFFWVLCPQNSKDPSRKNKVACLKSIQKKTRKCKGNWKLWKLHSKLLMKLKNLPMLFSSEHVSLLPENRSRAYVYSPAPTEEAERTPHPELPALDLRNRLLCRTPAALLPAKKDIYSLFWCAFLPTKVPGNIRKCPSAEADMKSVMSSLKIPNEHSTGIPAHTAWFPWATRHLHARTRASFQNTDEPGFGFVFCFHI